MRLISLACVVLCLSVGPVFAESALRVRVVGQDGLSFTVAWDHPLDRQGGIGYRVFIGDASGASNVASFDAGNVTQALINAPAYGTYYAAVSAYDIDGRVGPRSNEAVAVLAEPQPNISPNVWLPEPVSGSSYVSPASIPLAANASDPDGTINRVEFFSDQTLIGTDTAAPYAMTWIQGTPGTYTLTAHAIDNAGARSVSSPSVVTVNPQPSVPTGCVTNGVTYSVGSRVTWQVRVREFEAWLTARESEGWVYVQAIPQNRNQWRVTVECRPQ